MDSGEMMITVVKVGGALLEEPGRLGSLLDDLAAVDGPLILVHGGGPQATRIARLLGHEPVMVDGRRVTDRGMLDVVTMVYAGHNTTGVVAGLAARGREAVGLSGADLSLLRAVRRPVGEIDYGYVGDLTPEGVNVARLDELLRKGIVPVVAPLTWDGAGGLLNTNADTIATVVARALAGEGRGVSLLMIMDAPGLLQDGADPASVIDKIDRPGVDELKSTGALAGGILPKVDNALAAVEHGVAVVRIGDATMLRYDSAGTRIVAEKGEDVPASRFISLPGDSVVDDAVNLLRHLITIPSFSGEEGGTADAIVRFLRDRNYDPQRCGNNVWCRGKVVDPEKPTLLLNSHHDTVRPSSDYTRSPFEPFEEGGRLHGLGSNDAGGPLIALLAAFLECGGGRDLPVNLLFIASAEEETSGERGIGMVLQEVGPIDAGIVGEPTSLEIAVAEKGLLVLDCVAHGRSGHAARDEGENAVYIAMQDIEWFRTFRFEPDSSTLGPVHTNVTIISAGSAHNVVPDRCSFTVDIRTTDRWGNREVLDVVRAHVRSEVTPRSMRLNASGTPEDHPLMSGVRASGRPAYGSPTLSDQAQMPFPTIKFGPGDSARSHTADEYIVLEEIPRAVDIIISIIEGYGR